MISKATIIALAATLAVGNFSTEAQQAEKAPSDFFDACLPSPTNTEPTYHAFNYPERTIILPGYIQERRGVRQSANFILDTGTNRTIVDQSIARELSLNQVGENTLVASGGTVKSSLVEIDKFCVGGYESEKVVAAVQDLRLYSRQYRTGISMILGTDFLGNAPGSGITMISICDSGTSTN